MEEHLYITLFTAYCSRFKGATSDDQVEALARVSKAQTQIAIAVWEEKPKKLKGDQVGDALAERPKGDKDGKK